MRGRLCTVYWKMNGWKADFPGISQEEVRKIRGTHVGRASVKLETLACMTH